MLIDEFGVDLHFVFGKLTKFTPEWAFTRAIILKCTDEFLGSNAVDCAGFWRADDVELAGELEEALKA